MNNNTRKHTYPDCVIKPNIKILECQQTDRRLRLSIPLDRPNNNNNNKVLFIMMNPSKANEDKSDATINRVINYTYRHCQNINEIVILNLYTVYETQSSKLKNIVYQKGIDFSTGNDTSLPLKNDAILINEASQSRKIIIGWGRPSPKILKADIQSIQYHQRALHTLNLLQQYQSSIFHIGSLRDNIYPRHPSRIKDDCALEKLDFSNLVKEINKKL